MKPQVPGRLRAQGLVGEPFGTPAEVVRHLCCVQSQAHDMALWAVGRRMDGATRDQVQMSFDRGDFVRTHVLRPTWHYLDRGDLHWLLALTAPRIMRLMASSYRAMGLTEARLEKSTAVIVEALGDGLPHTRTEMAEAISAAGLETGRPLVHQLMHAEINALMANGPMQGKQHTYVLLPPAPPIPSQDELLAEVARRYGGGHGPFRDKDLAWWTSLTLTDSRRAIELAGLRPLKVAGETYWTEGEVTETEAPSVMLLSNFDEYISYARDSDDYAGFIGSVEETMRGTGLLFLDGRLAGSWIRAITAGAVRIEVRTPRLTAPARRALEAETEAFGRFVEREPDLVIPP